MKYDTIDTRVGYMTISIIANELKEYVDDHIKDRKYTGCPDLIFKYKQCLDYLDN